METIREDIQVHCPNCSNQRLFDCGESAESIIKIKCPRCRAVSVINLQHIVKKQQRTRIRAYLKIGNELHN